MKKNRTRPLGRALRRLGACLLAVVGLWMAGMTAALSDAGGFLGQVQTALATQTEPQKSFPLWEKLVVGDSAVLAQWAESRTPPAPSQVPEDTAENPNLKAATPENIQEKTITASQSAGYTNIGGVSLFNRTSKAVDLNEVAAQGVSLSFQDPAAGPQILIMHTHATEAFAQDPDHPYPESGTAHTQDAAYSILQVGDEIQRIFTEMGLNALHDKTLYDVPTYNQAYDRSRKGIEAMLAQYPTIQMVLDVHRDALVGSDGTVYKPVIQVDGVKTAQVMLVVGTDDAGASFPAWPRHLALAVRMEQRMNSLWPGLARPITLRTARFNQQLTPGSLLVEVGSHGNTLEEALAGARLFARAAGQVLLEQQGG